MENQSKTPELIKVEIPNDEDIDIQIVAIESRLSSYRGRRAIYFFLGMVALLGSVLIFFGKEIFSASSSEIFARQSALMGLALVAYSMLGAGYIAITRQSRIASLKQELDVLRAKKRIMSSSKTVTLDNNNTPPSYFDRLVDINVTNLEAYYGLVKVHTNNSFQVSITAGCIGFIFIITGLILGFTKITDAHSIAYISAGSGIVTEFIAGVFFYLYNRTVRQLKEYHDSLIQVQNILLSFKIVGDTKDETKKNTLMELMLKCLIATRPDKAPEDIEQPIKT